MCNRRLVDPASGVDIYRVGDFLSRLPALCLMLGYVLASRGEEQTSIGRKGQSPEERTQRLACIKASGLDAEATAHGVRFWRSFHGHDCG
jgi:hypothetical protein